MVLSDGVGSAFEPDWIAVDGRGGLERTAPQAGRASVDRSQVRVER
jgi:hypothetical protein